MQPKAHPAIAAQHYRMLELKSRVESAGPHALVGLLYEELIRSLDLTLASLRKAQSLSGSAHISKALSILIALEGSLDFEKGGDLASTLSHIYHACRVAINEAAKAEDMQKLSEVRQAISTIAYAWQGLSDT